MKVGIITFHNAHNYGAALQVFASQTLLTSMGYDCEVINYRIKRIDRSYEACSNKRKQKFENFMKQRLHLSRLYNTLEDLQMDDLPYDIIIAGSDQIWNSALLGGLNSAFFCNLGRPDARRIVYAASLGAEVLSASNRFLLPRYLQYPDFISVREASMLPLIEPLTEKPVATVLDPTFLLDLSVYQELITPTKIKEPFIYLHYVHHTGENPDLDYAAQLLAETTGLPIIKNRAGERFKHELPSCQDNGPEEFLGILSAAAYVVTDSFHATVFSMLFSKRFLTVPPVKRPERLANLLSLFGLDAFLYQSPFDLQEFLNAPSYTEEFSKRLAPLRKSSMEFLMHALTSERSYPSISYPTTANHFLCYGCGACTKLYPDQVEAFRADEDGFLYPSFSTDHATENSTVPCLFTASGSGLATLKSDSNTSSRMEEPLYVAAYHKDLYSRMISYDGGVLIGLIRAMHQQNGVVISKAIDRESGLCRYRCSETEADSIPFLSFQPEEADITELYSILSSLPEDRPALLFTVPCHIAVLSQILPDKLKQVVTVGTICGGVTSSVPRKAYTDLLNMNSESEIVDYNYSAKHYGESGLRAEFTHADGSLTTEYISQCPPRRAYNTASILRPSCYACSFRESFCIDSDLTLNALPVKKLPSFEPDDKIVSLLSINTKKGMDYWNRCSNDMIIQPLSAETASQLIPNKQFKLNASRPMFFERLHGEKPESCFAPYTKNA